ncbi:MAG: hypothetical protein ACOX4Y_04815 [Limnochordia bacterium]
MLKKTGSSRRSAGVLAVLLVTLVLFTSGCLTNPVTGRLGPSWQVPVRIPLIAAKVTVADLLDKADFAADPSEDGGFKAEFSVADTFDLQGVEVSFSPITVEADLIDIKPGAITEFSFTTKLELKDLWSAGTLEEVAFTGGTLAIALNAEANAEITAVTLGEHRQTGSSVQLAGLNLADQDELKIEGTLSDVDAHNIQSITVTLNAEADQITAIKGKSLQFELPVQTIDVDFEIPEDLKDVKFSNVKMSLGVKYASAAGNAPAIDLTGLNITGLTMPETVFTGETLIVFDPAEAANLLNSLPDTITISGDVKTGDASSTLSFADSLELEFTIIVPFDFELSSDMIYESEVVEIDVNEASLEGLEDIANSFYGEIDLDYRMPLAAKVELSLSNSDTPLSDPEAVLVEVEIEAAPTDAKGRTTGASPQRIPVELPEETRDLLQDKAYAQVRITIPAEGHELVSFSEQDYASVMAWIELLINVNK